jgi:hypothetical protein
MFHFKPSRLTPVPAPATRTMPVAQNLGRADHARMLAHAAKRRLSAHGEDAGYWKACAPAAIAKAVAIRTEATFARLP